MKNKFSIAMSLAVILAMMFTALAFAQSAAPTISSDLPDYGPGDTVHLTGTGWQAGEAVHIFVNDNVGQTWSYNADVTAADDGTISNTFQLPYWFVATYNVIATGTTSGIVTTTFTDGSLQFNESGLPSGTNWSVTWNGVTQSASAPTSISFGGQATTANYTVGSVTGYVASPSSGSASRPLTGNTPVNITFTLSDNVAPAASPTQSPAANANGWNNTDVTVTWHWSDNAGGSGIDNANCTTSSTSSGVGMLTLNATCKDLAGNTGSASYIVKVDKTNPTITFVGPSTAAWYNADVTANWSCSDALSGTVSASVNDTTTGEGTAVPATGTCIDNAGNSAGNTQSFKVDKTAPSISAAATTAPIGNGWYNSSVTIHFTCGDALSGVASCPVDVTLTSEGANQSTSGTVTDNAGNSTSTSVTGINIDKTVPTVSLVGGPANGATYYFGFVPAAPTCSANDVLSGIDGTCSVSGYSTAIGSHTVTAGATDKAGNSASASITYTVSAWTLKGFYQPVDMPTPTNLVYNTVKNGSTVPLKFEIFAGATELTDLGYVKSLTYAQTACDANATTDDIETVATGNTVLRYDSTSGQFIFNWKTPSTAGKCYRVTMTTVDGSSLVAYFKLK